MPELIAKLTTINPFNPLLGLVVAAGFALLGYIGLPPGLSTARRFYWVVVIFLASTLMQAITASLASFQVSVRDIENNFETVAKIAPVVEEFEKHFHDAGEPLRGWSKAALTSETSEFDDGYVDLRVDQAPTEIAKAYPSAQEKQENTGRRQYIFATNVGSTNLYFGSTQSAKLYLKANRRRVQPGNPDHQILCF